MNSINSIHSFLSSNSSHSLSPPAPPVGLDGWGLGWLWLCFVTYFRGPPPAHLLGRKGPTYAYSLSTLGALRFFYAFSLPRIYLVSSLWCTGFSISGALRFLCIFASRDLSCFFSSGWLSMVRFFYIIVRYSTSCLRVCFFFWHSLWFSILSIKSVFYALVIAFCFLPQRLFAGNLVLFFSKT